MLYTRRQWRHDRAAPAKKPRLRGAALIDAILAKVTGSDSPIANPMPLDAAQIRACEDALGCALPPSFRALLAYDAGFLNRGYRWFSRGSKQTMVIAVLSAVTAWLELSTMWPVTEPARVIAGFAAVRAGAYVVPLVKMAPKAETKALPFDIDIATAAIENALRAIHRRVPLERATLVVPAVPVRG